MSSSSASAPQKRDAYTAAYEDTISQLRADMPLIMHGAGDVEPSQVDPTTADLLARLSADYVHNLTEAALHGVTTIPPPPFKRRRQSSTKDTNHYWNAPLTSRKRNPGSAWVGAFGVDLWEHRIREAHVAEMVTASSFLFPLSHDPYVYGRVEAALQSSVSDFLLDPVVAEACREEGLNHLQRKKNITTKRKKKEKKEEKEADDDDEDEGDDSSDEEEDDNPKNRNDDDDEEDVPLWPGLESLLTFTTNGR